MSSTSPGTRVRVYLWPDKGTNDPANLVRIEDGVAILEDVGAGETRYSLDDGRQLDADGKQTALDFWRLDLDSMPAEEPE